MALLEVKQLTKHFGGLTAVGDVTLELNEGELVGLIGLYQTIFLKFLLNDFLHQEYSLYRYHLDL